MRLLRSCDSPNCVYVVISQLVYLIDLSIVNFTTEKIEELQKHIDKLNHELETLKSTTTRDMWKNELGLLIKKLK